jgi:hypothetical protein
MLKPLRLNLNAKDSNVSVMKSNRVRVIRRMKDKQGWNAGARLLSASFRISAAQHEAEIGWLMRVSRHL